MLVLENIGHLILTSSDGSQLITITPLPPYKKASLLHSFNIINPKSPTSVKSRVVPISQPPDRSLIFLIAGDSLRYI
ncbi:hypothetical protein L6452_00670 [Arctium lappa]|uniref:Uncharacterized protein n=1 Tax=Arctium lappa TaxID=4217 RepID=A0ACB9FFD2_ARCLA|nr:hypothetical protein L6452_00670 [Arctium lappa]